MATTEAIAQVRLWDTEAPPLEIVNSGDFRCEKLLRQLRLFGNPLVCPTSDGVEIKRRQRLLKYLMNTARRDLRDMLMRADGRNMVIPGQEQDFFDHFDTTGSSRFTNNLEEILARLANDQKSLPVELDALCSMIHGRLNHIRALERELYATISTELKKAVALRGFVTFHCADGRVQITSEEVCGHKKYATRRFDDRKWGTPDWMKTPWAEFLWIQGFWELVQGVQHDFWNRQGYGPLVLESLPDAFKPVLENFVFTMFEGNPLLGNRDGFKIQLFFTFEDDRLEVQVTNLDMTAEEQVKNHRKADERRSERFLPSSFPGYGRRHLRKVSHMRRKLVDSGLATSRELAGQMRILDDLNAVFRQQNCAEVPHSETLSEFSGPTVASMRRTDPELAAKCEEIEAFRASVGEHIHVLQLASQIVEAYLNHRKEWRLTASFPTVLDDAAHTISFSSITPVHLIGREVDEVRIRPQNLVNIQGIPKLNGQMVSLTGLNAGGKTVVLQELVDVLWLAHCGLMVFGKGLAFNPKEALALAFIERGEGSTAELLGRKAAAVLAAARDYPPHRLLVIYDELGTGTDQGVGLTLGTQVLAQLSRAGCSVLFTTQIPELAEHAHQKLGVFPFQMGGDHTITPGIGRSDFGHLAARTGLDQFLQQD